MCAYDYLSKYTNCSHQYELKYLYGLFIVSVSLVVSVILITCYLLNFPLIKMTQGSFSFTSLTCLGCQAFF